MTDRKEELFEEVKVLRKNLREKERELRGFGRVKYKHVCAHCGAHWEGNKEFIKQCTYCHSNIKRYTAKIPENIGSFEENCIRFDAFVKEKGEVVNKLKVSNTWGDDEEKWRTWIFRWKEDGIEYVKRDGGEELVHKTVKSTTELMHDWDWPRFLKETYEYVRLKEEKVLNRKPWE